MFFCVRTTKTAHRCWIISWCPGNPDLAWVKCEITLNHFPFYILGIRRLVKGWKVTPSRRIWFSMLWNVVKDWCFPPVWCSGQASWRSAWLIQYKQAIDPFGAVPLFSVGRPSCCMHEAISDFTTRLSRMLWPLSFYLFQISCCVIIFTVVRKRNSLTR